jgi:hypothetical protein
MDCGMPTLGRKESKLARKAQAHIEAVAATLENYARRGVFRGFSRGPVGKDKAAFRMVWHRDRVFEFIFDLRRKTMRFPAVLPNLPAGSAMYSELKKFIKSRQSDAVPQHRRIDAQKAQVSSYNRGGNVSLALTVVDGDIEYCTRKLINLVHEIFMVFLVDGSYYEYMVETFDLDPDRM